MTIKITYIELAVSVIASSDAAPYPALSAVISVVPVASVAKVQGDPNKWAGQFLLLNFNSNFGYFKEITWRSTLYASRI